MTHPLPAAPAPGFTPHVISRDLAKGLDALEVKAADNERASSYYEGRRGEVFASSRLWRRIANTGAAYRFNFARVPVDALTDRLEIAAVRSSDDGVTTTLSALWEANQLDLEAPQIHRRAGEHGDAYVMVWPRNPDAEDEPFDVGIYFNDSSTVRVVYDAENPLVKAFAIKRWKREDGKIRVDLLYAEVIERYLSKEGTKGEEATDFAPLVVDFEADETGEIHEVWPSENPFGEVPVFHFRTDRPYGRPEHEGFYGAQDAITKLVASHMSGVDYQSHPQRYALAAGETGIPEAAGVDEDDFSFDVEPGTNTSSSEGTTSQYKAGPGELWLMKGVTGVGQFEVADPETFLKPMTAYLRFGAQICTTPLRMFDTENAQLPSGESQAQADGPFVKKVRNRQLSYGATWQDIFVFALKVLGIEGVDVSVLWAPPNVVDDEAGWKTIALKLEAGVPWDQVMREAGYSATQVEAWMKDREQPPNNAGA